MFARVARYEVHPTGRRKRRGVPDAVAQIEGTNGLEGGYVCVITKTA